MIEYFLPGLEIKKNPNLRIATSIKAMLHQKRCILYDYVREYLGDLISKLWLVLHSNVEFNYM